MNESTFKMQCMGIVNQLFDLAEVPVDIRQRINDKADEYLQKSFLEMIPDWCKEQREICSREILLELVKVLKDETIPRRSANRIAYNAPEPQLERAVE